MSVTSRRSSWRRVRIGDIATVSRGASPRPIASPRWFSDTSKIGWVRIADLGRSDGLTLTSTVQRLSPDGVSRSRLLPPGTLIMSIAATVGRPIVTAIPACIHDGFVALENLKGVDQTYLLYVLKSLESDLQAAGQTGSQANVNTDIVKSLVLPVPPEPEQRAIGSFLTDADHTVAALERLITKKQDIKQGMMQQLLTGRIRLPGFTSEWGEVQLGHVADIKTGSRNNQDKKSGGRYPFYVRSATVEQIDSYSYDCEAILVPGEGGIGSIFHYVNGKFDVHQRVYKISHFATSVVGRFLFYYLQQFFGRRALEHSVKATVDSLRLPTFTAFTLHLPRDVDEQRAIAEVLADVDADLDALRRRLAKATAIKQGMMRELLSGRTRCPVEEAVA